MKQSLRFAVAAAAMGMAATASAGYFEIGTELESFNSDYSSSDMVLPYMAVGGNPIEGTPFSAELKTSYRQMTDNAGARSSNRYRQDITVGYSWNFGDFTFAPRYRLRQDFMNGGSRTYEHRIFPNMSYRLNDTFSLQLDGFVAPVQAKRTGARGDDVGTSGPHNYTDYKHDFDLRLHTQLSETQRLTVSVFTEHGNKKGYNDTDLNGSGNYQEDKMTEWQLRLVYSQNFGDFSLTPFARFGLSRKSEKVNGVKVDENRHRFGISGSYKLSNDLSLVGETYYQTQKQGHVADGATEATAADSKKNMMFYKLGVRYSF